MNHEAYMKRCLELAERGKGHVSPNPMVGAVLVHNNRIIGEGWHKEYGHAHAEVNCFVSVAEQDKVLIPESIMYVSLEPCAHHGNTPPCADRIVKEKVKEVVICNQDPFEKVSGRGISILSNNGTRVRSGVLEKEGRWVNRRFFCFHEQKRPYIMLKWAQSQDGFFAPLNRTRFQLTGKQSMQLLHKWRTEEDAIMVGFQTAMADDPELTARLYEGKNPLRIVVDKNLALDKNGKIFNYAAPTWILNAVEERTEDNLSYIKLDFDNNILHRLMERLYRAGKLSLIVEGGVKLLQSFIDAGLWDEARVFTAGRSMNEGLAAPVLKDNDPIIKTSVGEDEINVYTHRKTKYEYVQGYEL